ncbi:MAG: mucoidy inhibitor MuiA family protein [bacterium]|nr:mucoidy inhibitor MuiA family protein [bacterium]
MKKTSSKFLKSLVMAVVIFISTVFCQLAIHAEETVNINSTISEVTVFPDRARITRFAAKSFLPGNYILVFEKLPAETDENSIQVSGKGAAVLKEVNIKEVRLAKIPRDKVKQLILQEKSMEEKEKNLEDREEQIEKEKSFLDRITKKLTGVTEKSEPATLDPDKWVKLVSFYSSKLKSLDEELRSIEKQKNEVEENQTQIQWKLRDFNELKEKKRRQVKVKVTVKKEGKLTINLTYMVRGPKWTPVYELHADSKKKRMKIKYNAFLKQKTGEDWSGVKLNLSTAQPSMGAKHPDLNDWYITFRRPQIPKEISSRTISTEGASASQNMYVVDGLDSPDDLLEPESGEEMEEELASVKAGATSVIFTIDGKSTIKSGKTKHKVNIGSHDFPVHFRYSTIPKLKAYAYLKAKIVNKSPYPLLPGQSTIFLDNTFVTKSHMKKVAVNQDFWTFLGVDEGISVDYKVLDPFRKNKGVFKKKNKLVYKRTITIEYHKKTREELVVWDHIPMSKDEAIKVELIKPVVKDKSTTLKLTPRKVLEWFFKPNPGDKIVIPIEFTIQYPKDKELKGHMYY